MARKAVGRARGRAAAAIGGGRDQAGPHRHAQTARASPQGLAPAPLHPGQRGAVCRTWASLDNAYRWLRERGWSGMVTIDASTSPVSRSTTA